MDERASARVIVGDRQIYERGGGSTLDQYGQRRRGKPGADKHEDEVSTMRADDVGLFAGTLFDSDDESSQDTPQAETGDQDATYRRGDPLGSKRQYRCIESKSSIRQEGDIISSPSSGSESDGLSSCSYSAYDGGSLAPPTAVERSESGKRKTAASSSCATRSRARSSMRRQAAGKKNHPPRSSPPCIDNKKSPMGENGRKIGTTRRWFLC